MASVRLFLRRIPRPSTYTHSVRSLRVPFSRGIRLTWPENLTGSLYEIKSEEAQAKGARQDDEQQMIDLSEILAWITETTPSLSTASTRRSMTEDMRRSLTSSGWTVTNSPAGYGQLQRRLEFDGFQDSFLFLARMSQAIAHSVHFPEIEWEKNYVVLTLRSYGELEDSAHYISEADVELANKINRTIQKFYREKEALPVNDEAAAKRNFTDDLDRVVKSGDASRLNALVREVFIS